MDRRAGRSPRDSSAGAAAVADAAAGSATFGFFRLAVVMPVALLCHKSASRVEPFLAHKLMHTRRGAAAFGGLQILAQIVW
jgi:hypothetical protein